MDCRLFIKSPPREAVTPVYNEKVGKWNQVCTHQDSSFTFELLLIYAKCCFMSTFWLCVFLNVCVSNLQLDPALKMDNVEPESAKTRGVLFQLHPVTLLNS